MNKLRLETVSNIGDYIKILRNGEFIIDDNSYQKGVKSLYFKINPELFSKDIKSIEILPNSRIFKRLKAKTHNRKAHANRMPLHLKAMLSEFRKLEMDYKGSYTWINKNATANKKTHYIQSIKNIEDKRLRYFKRNKTNKRLDTNLTNMKSELRQFIKGKYVSIDLKNSQPFLLSMVLKNIIHKGSSLCCLLQEKELTKTFGKKRLQKVLKTHQNREKSEMVSLCLYNESALNGNLYDDFIQQYSESLTRDEVKDIIFRVLFSKNVCKNKFIPFQEDKKKFKKVFPIVYESVKELKDRDNRTLPIYLQRLESYLFIDCIAKELVQEGIVPFTIHDSVIVKETDIKLTLKIINNVFMQELGIVPALETKKLMPITEDKVNTKQVCNHVKQHNNNTLWHLIQQKESKQGA